MSSTAEVYPSIDTIEAAKARHPSAGHTMLAFGLLQGNGDPVLVTEHGIEQGGNPLIGGAEIIEFPLKRVGSAVVELAEHEPADAKPYNPRIDEISPEYPNITFSFNRSWIEGNGVVDATKTSRMRAVLKALHEQAGEEPKRVEDITQAHKHFLTIQHQRVNLPDGTIVAKGELLPAGVVLEQVGVVLKKRNHPVIQALTQFEAQFPDLSPATLGELREQLLAATSLENIRDTYKQAVYRAKYPSHESETV